jgi:hypothetical protein
VNGTERQVLIVLKRTDDRRRKVPPRNATEEMARELDKKKKN